jgi:thiamine-phosphate pyrophosphorylase
MLPKLQYISQGKNPNEHLDNIRQALEASVKLVQLRLKNIEETVFVEYAKKTQELCVKHNAFLIINDNPAVAKACGSFGLHLGLDDMPVHEAKKIVDAKAIGGTANTFEHIQQRCSENVSYIGLGPYRFTATKEKLSPVLGISGYDDILTKMKENHLNTPVFAIGGIELDDIAGLAEKGVYGIAVSGMLTHSQDKKSIVKQINKILKDA